MTKRTPERASFLADVLSIGTIEVGSAAQFELISDNIDFMDDSNKANWYAEIQYLDDDGIPEGEVYRVTIDTIAKGIGIIKNSIAATNDDGETYWHDAKTFERLFLNGWVRETVISESAENECTNIDMICGTAIVECALFGKVVYV